MGRGFNGGWVSLRAPNMHSMSSQRWPMHVQGQGEHVHCSSHSCIVLSRGLELWFIALVSV